MKNVPDREEVTESAMREVLEGAGVRVESITFHTPGGRRTALVRLPPPLREVQPKKP